jgi:hypothetical protein
MHQQPRDPFQPADPYQRQGLGAQYQEPAAPPPGTSPYAYQPPPQQPGQRRRWPYILLVVAAAVISFATGESAGKSGQPAAPSPGASATPAATAQPAARTSYAAPSKAAAPPPARPHVIARFTGSGIENTSQFTIGGSGNWELRWSYNCSSLGSSGNFIVGEDNNNDLSGASVNELGPAGHGVTHVYSDAGRHYLSVNSECSWKMTAVSQP